MVKGYRIPFIKITFQRKLPNFTKMNQKQIALVGLELKEMLRKGEIMRNQSAFEQLIPCGEKRRRLSPCDKSKMFNQFIPFLHFKMEGLSQLKHIIQKEDWM